MPACKSARLIVVMGSTGCGKSTVGGALADKLDAVFIEGDQYHSAANREKMHAGFALSDEDRWPWLQTLAVEMCGRQGRVVTSCSSLRKAYREHITLHAGEPVLFVYLHGDKELLAARLAARSGHFMNKDLLDSQLQTLEVPDETEFSLLVEIDRAPDDIVQQIVVQVF